MYAIKKFNKHFKYAITAMFIMATITTSSFQMINAQINPIADPPTDWAFETSSQGLNDIIIEKYPNIDINKDGYISIEEANTSLESKIIILNQNLDSTLNGIHHFTNVTRIEINNSNLQGEIPKDFGNMYNLIALNLSGNNLIGEIPSELANLTNLETLYLPKNNLQGTIPSNLGYMPNLMTLSLQGNNLSGEIPSQLGNLTKIDFLYLQNNNLTGEIPSSFINLKSDANFQAYNNKITGLAGQRNLWDNFNSKLKVLLNISNQTYLMDLDYNVISGNPFTVEMTLPIHSQIRDFDSTNSSMTYSLITPNGVIDQLENDNRFVVTNETITSNDNTITFSPGEYFISAKVIGGVFNGSVYQYKFDVENRNYTFNNLSANGVSKIETTTQLTITLDQDVVDLNIDDITLSNNNINKDLLTSQSNGVYTLDISGEWNNGEIISVTISKQGNTFTPASRNVSLYLDTRTPYQFIGLSANGESNITSTTQLIISLDKMLPYITKEDITISNKDIIIKSLSGSNIPGEYKVGISGDWNNEDVTEVTITKDGSSFTPNTREVSLYKDTRSQYIFERVEANGESNITSTTQLTISLDQDVADLNIDDITLSNNNINKDLLTSQSNGVYKLDISGDWNNEDVIEVTITKDGSVFTPSSKEVSIYKERIINEYEFKSISANGESNITSTTQLTISLDQDVADLNIDNITLSNNNINKDLLTSQSNGVYKLDISGDWNNEDVIDVSIAQDGSNFTPDTKQVTLYKERVINEYVFNSISANGVSDVETTTELTLTFNQDIEDLTIDNITLSSDKINLDSLTSQSNGIYTLAISGDWNNEDVIDVSLAHDGSNFTPDTKQVTLYKERVINEYEFKSVEANGVSDVETTTELTLTFDQDIEDLTIDNITLSNNAINMDFLTSQTNGVYTLSISGDWENEDVIDVSLAQDGSNFTPDTKQVTLYKERVINEYLFNSISANGSSDVETTTELTLTFDQDVADLTIDNITLSSDKINKGTLTSQSNGIYTLAISGDWNNEDVIDVSLAQDGSNFTPDTKQVTLYKDRVINEYEFKSVEANGVSASETTTELTLTLDKDVVDLVIDDITLSSDKINKGTLTSQSNGIYTLAISGDWKNEDVIDVSLAQDGSNFTPDTKQVTLYKERVINEYEFKSVEANGVSSTETTTELTLTFDQNIADLTIDNITLSNNAINIDSLTSLTNGVYKIEIRGEWENEDIIDVIITKDGSVFSPSTKQVSLYLDNSGDNIDDKEVDIDKEDNINDNGNSNNDDESVITNNPKGDIPKTGANSPLGYILAFITSLGLGFGYFLKRKSNKLK